MAASKAGRRGGRGRTNKEIQDVKAHLLRLAKDVEEGRLDPKVGSIVSQILNVYLRGVETERKIKETEELEHRIEELEELLGSRANGRATS
ncbi:hypothetical protein RxyAA322_06130 [Rubrobacter xylanophilus]|uniref:Uncharacterized protein n=1 Tax=Rubrobacter xylanophilus TaxID=49319 RepID=A0A510HFP4_9ACTN|nr:hypothetical protein RxyAA322_06130 [Rubrobacter xylanophilus]